MQLFQDTGEKQRRLTSIFVRLWIRGEGKPPDWDNLIEALKAIGLVTLASDMQEGLQLASEIHRQFLVSQLCIIRKSLQILHFVYMVTDFEILTFCHCYKLATSMEYGMNYFLVFMHTFATQSPCCFRQFLTVIFHYFIIVRSVLCIGKAKYVGTVSSKYIVERRV